MNASTFHVKPARRRLLLSLLAAMLSGCATLPSSGPTASRIERSAKASQGALQFAVVDVDAAALDTLSRSDAAQTASPGLAVLARAYQGEVVGPGDVLDISVYEVGVSLFGGSGTRVSGAGFDPSARGERFPPLMVDSEGGIALPYVGRLRVAGLTTGQVQQAIERSLASKSQDPKAVVAIRDNVSSTVYVSGDVRKPGRIPLTPNRERLLDVIATAGGSATATQDTVIRFARGEQVIEQRLGDIRPGGADDLTLVPADRIELVRQPRSFVVFGATNRVSQVPFDTNAVTLAEAIARVGGPSDATADPSAIFLFRYDAARQAAGERPIIYRLNMLEPASYFLAQRFPIHDKDVLYFANARANQPAKLFGILNLLFSPFITARQLTNNN